MFFIFADGDDDTSSDDREATINAMHDSGSISELLENAAADIGPAIRTAPAASAAPGRGRSRSLIPGDF